MHTAQQPVGLAGPLLLIDKSGFCTAQLLSLLHSSFRIVYLGADDLEMENVHSIRFGKLLPKLPDLWYSHIVVFFNGEQEVHTILPALLEKARKDNAHLVVVTFLPYATLPFIEQLPHTYKKTTVVVVGDVFAAPKPLRSRFQIDRLIKQARSGHVTLSSSGSKKLYPVLYEDSIDCIVKSFLGSVVSFGMRFAFSPVVLTDFSLARVLSHEDPSLAIDFSKKADKNQSEIELPHGSYMLDESYDVLQKLREQFADPSNEPEPVSLTEVLQEKPKKKTEDRYVDKAIGWGEPIDDSSKVKKTARFLLFFVLSTIILPPLLTGICGVLGGAVLLHAKNRLEQGALSETKQETAIAQVLFSVASSTSGALSMEADLLHLQDAMPLITSPLQEGESGAVIMNELASSGLLLRNVFTNKSTSPSADFTTAINNAKNALGQVQELSLSNSSSEFLSQKLTDLSGISGFLSSTADVLPHLFGVDSSKTYLVLFENNMELRPGGGFIGSYGLLTLKNGGVKDFTIHDVYETDGQLKKHIEPPFPVRRYMKQQHLYLRDANFSVDFPKNASQIAALYELETGKKVDGILSVDLSVIQTILQASGPVRVSDYNETVTAKNVSELTEKQVETNFFPGSTQKKDFLSALLLAIQQKVQGGQAVSYLALTKGLSDALLQKHVLFAFSEQNIETLFAVNGYSSSLSSVAQQGDISDFLNVSDANIGTNKVNYFIHRKFVKGVQIAQDGTVSGTTTIYYENTSSEWNYKNYVQVVVPQGATLTGITINGKTQNIVPAITDPLVYERPGFTSPQGLEVDTQQVSGKTVFGFLLNVLPKDLQTVTVSYTLPQKIELTSPSFTYSLSLFKQPGTENDPLDFSLSYPTSFRLVKAPDSVRDQNNVSIAKLHLDQDQTLSLQFAQK